MISLIGHAALLKQAPAIDRTLDRHIRRQRSLLILLNETNAYWDVGAEANELTENPLKHVPMGVLSAHDLRHTWGKSVLQ